MPIGWCEYPREVLPESHWRALYEANMVLIDGVMEDLVALRSGTPFADLTAGDLLPSRYVPRYDESVLRRFLACLVSVGLKLRLPGFHPLGCTAEELALHVMVARACERLDEEEDAPDFGAWESYAFEDTDFLLLYEQALDGIEDTPAGQALGIDHLHLAEWFLPFNPPRVVHPYADTGGAAPWEADHEHYAPEDDGDGEQPE